MNWEPTARAVIEQCLADDDGELTVIPTPPGVTTARGMLDYLRAIDNLVGIDDGVRLDWDDGDFRLVRVLTDDERREQGERDRADLDYQEREHDKGRM